MSVYSVEELKELGFAQVGHNVLVSRKASFYGTERISLGDHVRIDDFCVLSAGAGGIHIGNYIHIAVYSSIIGGGSVTLNDYCNISARVSIYSSNDDYSGEYMTNPMVDACYTNVSYAPVVVGKHVIVGSGSIVLPGVTLGDGCAVGALSLVSKSLNAWGVYVGQPAKYIKARRCELLTLEEAFLRSYKVKSAENR